MIPTRALATTPLDQVEYWYHNGHINQAQFEAYMHVWATEAPRLSNLANGWTNRPTDHEVAALVDELRSASRSR